MIKENDTAAKYTLLICTLASFLAPFMGSALNLALVDIQQDLNGNQMLLNWLVASFLLASAPLMLIFGRLGDMRGRRDLFIAGLASFGVAALACALAPSIYWLLFCRVVQGMGAAMMFSTGMAILTAAFPPEKRGHVLGINAAAVYSGLALGPVLGGFLTHWLGWRSIFFAMALVAIPAAFGALARLPNDRRKLAYQEFDKSGAVVIAMSLVLLMYGASTLNTNPISPWLAGAGLAGMALFWVVEKKAAHPILNISVFSGNTVFIFSNLAALLNYCATFAVNFLMSLYLLTVRGLDSQHAGMLMLVQPVLMTAVSPLAGKLSDRFPPQIISSVGMGMTAIGTFLLTYLSADTSDTVVIGLFILLGTGFGLFASPNNNAIMSSVEKSLYGVASSSMGTMRMVGQAISMAIVAFIFARDLGPVKVGPEVAPQLLISTHTAFYVFCALCVLGIFASFARGRQA